MRKIASLGSVALVVALAGTGARAAAPEACPGNHGAPAEVITGSFGPDMEGAHVMVPFVVPEDRTRVRVKLCYDQPDLPTSAEIKHTLDLGIFEATEDGYWDEDEFRGWGGSSRPNVLLTPEQATVGFLPGEISDGPWAAEIGVAAVADEAEGDTDATVEWRLEIFHSENPDDLDDPWEPEGYDEAPADVQSRWYKGDFHVHAEHSAPNDASMRDTFDYAFRPYPMGAGLDFITLSDYVTSRHWGEIGRFQSDYPGKLIMRSAEVITYRGHVNNHGSVTYVDHRTGPVYSREADGSLTLLKDSRFASEIFDAIHAAGGFTQVNHPTTFPATIPGFANLCRGCSWEYSDTETDWSKVDAMEVGTGPGGTSEPQMHELGPNPFTPLAIQWWDELRVAGFDVTAVGSSDSHHAGGGNGITQSPIGEATTVVYAEELSERGIQEAIEAGHAYIKFFSANGPDLRLTAVATEGPNGGPGKGRPEGMMGDTLPVGAAHFTAKVLNGAPSPEPRILAVLKDGLPYMSVPVTDADFTFEFDATEPGIYRLQLQRMSSIEALTNPITLAPRGDESRPVSSILR